MFLTNSGFTKDNHFVFNIETFCVVLLSVHFSTTTTKKLIYLNKKLGWFYISREKKLIN